MVDLLDKSGKVSNSNGVNFNTRADTSRVLRAQVSNSNGVNFNSSLISIRQYE